MSISIKMEEQPNAYKDELKTEMDSLDVNSNAYRLLQKEMERVDKGEPESSAAAATQSSALWMELHHDKPQSLKFNVRIPVKEHPKFNFVGKLLGPKGVTLRRLQEDTGTKMSILGRGSMRDKQKEDDLRKEGGKYAHLNQDLHLMVEVFSEPVEGLSRLQMAFGELKKFLVPQEFNDDIRAQQFEQMGFMNGENARGGYGGRGGPRGRGGPAPRGGMASRGAPGPRGAPRGGPPPRGGARGGRGSLPPGRGRAAPPVSAYDEYSSQGYDESYTSSGGGYRDPGYEQGYEQGGTQYYDYGHGAGAGGGAGYDYGAESGWGGNSASKPERGRGKAAYGQRSHPYSRGGGGGGY